MENSVHRTFQRRFQQKRMDIIQNRLTSKRVRYIFMVETTVNFDNNIDMIPFCFHLCVFLWSKLCPI